MNLIRGYSFVKLFDKTNINKIQLYGASVELIEKKGNKNENAVGLLVDFFQKESCFRVQEGTFGIKATHMVFIV